MTSISLATKAWSLLLYEYAGINGDDIILVGQEGIDVHLLDFGSEAEERREAHDNLGILLLVDTCLSARAFYYLVSAQRVNHAVCLLV